MTISTVMIQECRCDRCKTKRSMSDPTHDLYHWGWMSITIVENDIEEQLHLCRECKVALRSMFGGKQPPPVR